MTSDNFNLKPVSMLNKILRPRKDGAIQGRNQIKEFQRAGLSKIGRAIRRALRKNFLFRTCDMGVIWDGVGSTLLLLLIPGF